MWSVRTTVASLSRQACCATSFEQAASGAAGAQLSRLAQRNPGSTIQIREMSTARRQRNRLRVKSSPLFAPSTKAADHIIYAPPSSSPNVYHTPMKFLPPKDPRRQLFANTPLPSAASAVAQPGTPLSVLNPSSSQSSPSSSSSPQQSSSQPSGMGILLQKPAPKRYHLTEEDFEQIRLLRESDPEKWTVSALAKKFECSKLLITMVAPNESARAKHFGALQDQIAHRASKALKDRVRRREMWTKV